MTNDRLIPYQPLDLAEPADLVAEIRKRRGGQLINLDRMLLHSEPVARGWNHFIGNVRQQL
ncbi:MAG: carboxymuconolactone decarboxylase family protein, partial [Burkholderiaceae bacterium]|nr:carboxymuconolactone decarboxylase family protein [Burkholderiaceae bacterium]